MSAQDTNFYKKTAGIFNGNSAPVIMGILNITPDSFYDGGRYEGEGEYLLKAKQLIAEGVDIIDIGAQSTKPGAIVITAQEEAARLIPVIHAIRGLYPEVIISVDTFRASVAQKAIDAGADMINDISGGTMDEQMFTIVAKLQVPYILMHIQGTPPTMQKNPHYKNVTEEVMSFFKTKITELTALGVTKIIIDPGFGFGKTVEHNYQLLNDLEMFNSFNVPVLVGVSRKSMIYKPLHISPDEALNGTTVINTIALMKGAKIVRVHDVKEAKEAVTLVSRMKNNVLIG